MRHVPNILTIDKIDKMLDGKHPDFMNDVKNRFKYGLFLAKPKKDPLTRAFLHGSLNEKAYNFTVPGQVSDVDMHQASSARQPQGPVPESRINDEILPSNGPVPRDRAPHSNVPSKIPTFFSYKPGNPNAASPAPGSKGAAAAAADGGDADKAQGLAQKLKGKLNATKAFGNVNMKAHLE